jgi:cell division protein FtsI/penicillin-binding protein 2
MNEIRKKLNKLTLLIGIAFLAIFLRVCYLACFQHEEYLEKARKPQRRTIVEEIGRAAIRDRFHLPFAINKIQFNAAIRYIDIRQIPNFRYQIDQEGHRIKVPVRAQYIEALSQKLAKELNMEATAIEDMIHGEAAISPHSYCIIAQGISEEQYYRLRMLEKDWPGLTGQQTMKRHYPYGKVACDVIGVMGAISPAEYRAITEQAKELKKYIVKRREGQVEFLPKGSLSPFDVEEKYRELQRKAYTLSDVVGKSGIEAAFDRKLKGSPGKKLFEIDVQGKIIRELPIGVSPIPGRSISLTLSAELQAYAEELLAHSEWKRSKYRGTLKEPWIKGGAIVVMDAKTGTLLTLASYPRFDMSDFLKESNRKAEVGKWMENSAWIAQLWDGHATMTREIYGSKGWEIEEMPLTWEHFKEGILPPRSNTRIRLDAATNLQAIFALQHPENDADFLLADLSRLIGRNEDYPQLLQEKIGKIPSDLFFQMRQSYLRLKRQLEGEASKYFIQTLFMEWRTACFRDFLKKKRIEEKLHQRPPKPYTYYLDREKRKMFKEFWKFHSLSCMEMFLLAEETILPSLYEQAVESRKLIERDLALQQLAALLKDLTRIERKALLQSFKDFQDLKMALFGNYQRVRRENGDQTLKHLASSFYPIHGYGFARSQAFRQSTPAGSVFKLVIAYQALIERYHMLKQQHHSLSLLNPLVLIDESPQNNLSPNLRLGWTEDGKPIPRVYKGGRLPRSSHPGIGQIDLVGALEQSSNIYFSLLAAEHIQHPSSLTSVAKSFGFGEKSGIELPGEIRGVLPQDLEEELSAIYAYAIGQHSLVVTPLQTAVMINALVGKGDIVQPSIIQSQSRSLMDKDLDRLFDPRSSPTQQILKNIGIHAPIFTLTAANFESPGEEPLSVQIKHSLFLPAEVRNYLLDGMKQVMHGAKGTARKAAVKSYCFDDEMYRSYLDVLPRIAGKTGTAEVFYTDSIDPTIKGTLRKHTSFAGASFRRDKKGNVNWDDPDLIVVVYLRFSDAGREAAPLAGLMVKKWEEICARHSLD